MSWTSAEEIRRKIERRWKRGEILRALIGLENPFPLRLGLSVPSPREMALEFGRAQEWIISLRALSGTRLEWRSVRSPTLGQQEIPAAVWIDRARGRRFVPGCTGQYEMLLRITSRHRSVGPGGIALASDEPFPGDCSQC